MKKLSVVLLAVCAAGVLSAYETYTEAYKAANALRSKRDFTAAAAAFVEAGKLAKSPEQKFSAAFMEGVALCEGKQYDKGISLLREALKLAVSANQRVSCQFHVGYYLGVEKKYEEAIAEMRKVREFGKGTKNSYVELAEVQIGRCLAALKKYDEALAAVKDFRAGKNKNVAFQALAVSYDANKGLKNTEGMQAAVDGLLALKELPPNMFFTARRYAFELARAQKKHTEALKYADEIVAKEGLNKLLHNHGVFYKALSYASLGDRENELAQWKLLEHCGTAYFEASAARNIKRLTEKK